MWKFENIPEEEQNRVVEAHKNGDTATLYEIYTKHKVPTSRVSPCCASRIINEWTQWAIRNNKIKSTV